jgi:hypothetical protein
MRIQDIDNNSTKYYVIEWTAKQKRGEPISKGGLYKLESVSYFGVLGSAVERELQTAKIAIENWTSRGQGKVVRFAVLRNLLDDSQITVFDGPGDLVLAPLPNGAMDYRPLASRDRGLTNPEMPKGLLLAKAAEWIELYPVMFDADTTEADIVNLLFTQVASIPGIQVVEDVV